ncbi:MAG TPA: ATP-binding protein [Gallionella sp.]|nr:ATP-binding protein [Gallionella sp.]
MPDDARDLQDAQRKLEEQERRIRLLEEGLHQAERLRKMYEEVKELAAMRAAQLEAANKELETFSFSVSHDLRAPLRAISGFSMILLEDYAGKLDDEGKRLLNVVRENVARMEQLIEDILQFSRAGRLEINVTEVDMEALAHAVLEELGSASGGKLQVTIGHLPSAQGDRAMLRQVLVNLLSNALKFSRNKEEPRIEMIGSVAQGEAVFFVKDNGAGFNMQYVDKLFGVFQRLHTVDEFEGTGIGLAIVKRIITRHGGRVWAEGKVNEGATFYFALPIEEKEHD